jgi:hypothetical protein
MMKVDDVNRRVPPVSTVENHCGIEMETVLRIRPLLKKERDDLILLEARESSTTESNNNEIQTVILNPLNPSPSAGGGSYNNRSRTDSDSTAINTPLECHFNHFLPENTSQDKIYYTIGLPIVTATMNSLKNATSRHHSSRDRMPKNHLLISMGVENSGKTYTCFGGITIPKRRASQDGLVPRLLDSMFSQSNHASGGSKGFTVQVSILQVTQPKGGGNISDPNSCQIHDLLATPPQSSSSPFGASPKIKKKLNVRNIAARFERAIPSPVNRRTSKASDDKMVELDPENIKPAFQNCRDITQAREVLQNGFNTSQKHRTGDQNYHLYITMQPVIDGTKFGDSISILDMAGLEKEKTKQNIRGKQDVTSTNQAANEAVLDCLKTMVNNINIAGAKTTYSDDEVSELSSVSQAKRPITRDQLKPVPFRRHKVTMILNQLFVQNSSVKVTLLLAAYPGHIDFQQKRMLLQQVEMLHGSTLVATSLNTISAEDNSPTLMKMEDRNKNNELQKRRNSSNQRRTVKLATTFEQGQESDDRQNVHQNEQKAKARTTPPRPPQRMQKVSPAKPSAPVMNQENRASPSESFRFVEQKVVPSAPAFREIQQQQQQQSYIDPVDESFVSDFPGAQIPASAERNSGFTSESVSFPDPSTARRTSRERRPIAVPQVENDSSNFFRQEASASFPRKAETKNNLQINQQEKLKSPLGRSRLENSEHHHATSSKTASAQNDSRRKEDDRFSSNGNEIPSHGFDDNFAAQANGSYDSKIVERSNDQNESNNQVKILEAKLKRSIQEKKALEQICSQLEKENAELKNNAREVGRKQRQLRWTEQDEEEFLESRKMRQEAQSILKEPIYDHLEKVKYIYGIKNQWCMTDKKHFSLSLPNQFQRAPALDIRDSNMIQEDESDFRVKSEEGMQKHNKTVLGDNKNKASGLARRASRSIRKSLTPPCRKPPLQTYQAPAGLSRLKQLTGKRLEYN